MIWTISKIWNESIEQRDERPIAARNRLWASELGKSDIDLYYKLLGEKPSNPFDSRAFRKFEAGNLFEWIVKMVLIRCGIYQESQKWIGYKMDNNSLEVSGKLDHLAGGKPDYEKAEKEIANMMLPELFTKATTNILEYFKKEYPDGLPQQGIEVKSTSSFGIEKVYATNEAMQGHDLQAFHYAYNAKLPFILLYICRDDLRMADLPILPDNQKLLEKYQAKIKSISEYYNQKKEPPKEPEIIFDSKLERFSKNFNIEYSGYLTRLYGYQTPNEYDEKIGPKVESWNRVITRIKDKKEMTDNNKEKLTEISKYGFDLINLINNHENF